MTATQAGLVRTPFWMRAQPRPALPQLQEDIERDVVIVGAGLTGLWTAHYLLEGDPALSIAILEAEQPGYGASGRNGGWLSNLVPGHEGRIAAQYGPHALERYRNAVRDSVGESIRAATALGIEADIVKSGTLSIAFHPAQVHRQLLKVERSRSKYPDDGLLLLNTDQLRDRVNVSGALSAAFNPHAARVHPGKLLAGLVDSLLARGVEIFANSRVSKFGTGAAHTELGNATAHWVIRATEGFTTALPGGDREFLSMNSSVAITRPQSTSFWERVGWTGQELISDAAHDYVYGQRTADGRIALGGRGVPYRFRNGYDLEAPTPASTLTTLTRALTSMFPGIDAEFEDSWSGVLAVARDWSARLTVDSDARLITAGGYVGHGLSATNLAGRTIADLVTGTDSELLHLPWVGHSSRRWEPEPLRWLGARSIYAGYRLADQRESRSRSDATSAFARLATTVSGRP